MLSGMIHGGGVLTVEVHWEGNKFAGRGFPDSDGQEHLLLKAEPREGVVCFVVGPRRSGCIRRRCQLWKQTLQSGHWFLLPGRRVDH